MKILYTINMRDGSVPRTFYATQPVDVAEGVVNFVNEEEDEHILYPLDFISMVHGKRLQK